MASFITHYQSPLGAIRVSGTESYISEVLFEDEGKETTNHRFNTTQMPELLIEAVEQLIQYFQGQRRTFNFPISQEGTAFQQKVWHELLNIPFGRTISYLELSRRLGDPKAIRAAAAANGKNNICIVVPCHRVIGSKMDLVGYAGGLWRKRRLLELENRIANGVQTLF